jgi:hypothetical protein
MLEKLNIADEFGFGWLYQPLNNVENDDLKFEESRGWNSTKWIVLSSTFFSIPAIWHLTNCRTYIYAELPVESEIYVKIIVYYSAILLLSSLISMNYWRKATKGWRRNADLIFAKITFVTGWYLGIKYTRHTPYLITVFAVLPALPYVYGKSTKFVSENNPNWIKYHVSFHVLLTVLVAVLMDGVRTRIIPLT